MHIGLGLIGTLISFVMYVKSHRWSVGSLSLCLFFGRQVLCLPSSRCYDLNSCFCFFLIIIYTNGYSMHEKHRANLENTRRTKQRENKKENQTTYNYKRERELRKEGRESLVVNPHAQDQSKRVLLKEASIWSPELSKSSKVHRFRSFQIHYRMHNGTKFQIWDKCFPN